MKPVQYLIDTNFKAVWTSLNPELNGQGQHRLTAMQRRKFIFCPLGFWKTFVLLGVFPCPVSLLCCPRSFELQKFEWALPYDLGVFESKSLWMGFLLTADG